MPPVVEDGWDAVLNEAKNANIPVIIVDRSVSADPSLYASHIGSDLELEGKRAAEEINKLLPDGGAILELSGTTGSGAAVGRAKVSRSPQCEHQDPRLPDGNFHSREASPLWSLLRKQSRHRFQGLFITTMTGHWRPRAPRPLAQTGRSQDRIVDGTVAVSRHGEGGSRLTSNATVLGPQVMERSQAHERQPVE